MMGLRLAEGIDRTLFQSVAGADPVEALGEAKLAPLVAAGFLEIDADASHGHIRRPPAPQRTAGAPHRMRLLVFVLTLLALATSAWAQAPGEARGQARPAAGQARGAQVAVHTARLQDHGRDRGRLSAVQLSRP